MEYFSFDRPTGTATCSDADCSCPRDPIGAGSGFLFVSNQVVRHRRQESKNGNSAVPILLCRDAARRRDLDLEVAAQDAAHWWETGSVALRATPRRELKFKEFSGTSIEEAQRLAREDLGDELLGADVAKDVREMSSTAQARSADDAVAIATKRVPQAAFDVQPAKIIQEGQKGEVEVTVADESDARSAWRRDALRGAQLDDLQCTREPKRGFVGLGKAPGTWVARWSAPFIAEVAYKTPAVVTARYFS